jgi:hypothetical protein
MASTLLIRDGTEHPPEAINFYERLADMFIASKQSMIDSTYHDR